MDIVEIVQGFVKNNVLVTFIVSLLPVVELRGAIPVGVGLGLHPWMAMLISIVGNLLPVPFIILFIRRIFAWMRKKSPKLEKLVEKLESRAEKKKDAVLRWQFFGLVIFVAIPLPGTGAWTGALIAALMDMRLKSALPSIIIGVVIAGLLVTGITFGFTEIFA